MRVNKSQQVRKCRRFIDSLSDNEARRNTRMPKIVFVLSLLVARAEVKGMCCRAVVGSIKG